MKTITIRISANSITADADGDHPSQSEDVAATLLYQAIVETQQLLEARRLAGLPMPNPQQFRAALAKGLLPLAPSP